jgi:lipopolysaccharide transport system ATP-binding protein
MSSELAIELKNLGKCYHIYDKPQDRLKQGLWRGRKRFYREFTAVDDVSFTVRKGETVGIVGRNGSGKSTLLQLICGTLRATSGRVETHGRLAALLELGAGFNAEFSGRENVYINASIMGLSNEQIDAQYDSIIEFSEIGDFIDQPVKTYSSGMYVRLAFSVAICVDPDVLILDEALAVGDEAFQRKCFARIQSMQEKGCAILFVSHSSAAVLELCDRAILIDGGRLLIDSKPKAVVEAYQKMLFSSPEDAERLKAKLLGATPAALALADESALREARSNEAHDKNLVPTSTMEYPSRGAEISDVRIENVHGETVNILVMGQTYHIKYSVFFKIPGHKIRFGTLIKNVSGLAIGGLQSHPVGKNVAHIEAGRNVHQSFAFKCSLLPGVYFINSGVMGVLDNEETFLHRIIDVAMFKVSPEQDLCADGMINLGLI